jgi:hypothetical protein
MRDPEAQAEAARPTGICPGCPGVTPVGFVAEPQIGEEVLEKLPG